MLDTLFMDGLYSDLERLSRINQLIDSVPAEHRGPRLSRMRPIDTMVVVPSEDLRQLAHRHREALPVALRTLLWGISGRGRGEGRLLSYLMFEQALFVQPPFYPAVIDGSGEIRWDFTEETPLQLFRVQRSADGQGLSIQAIKRLAGG